MGVMYGEMGVSVAVEWRHAGSTWRVEIMVRRSQVRESKARRAALFKSLNQVESGALGE